METVTALVRSIFQKESLDDCSLEELQAMARQFSYFTPVQFLLAEKLKTTDENLYREQLQRLSLHFNNPLWLDYLLNSDKTEGSIMQARSETPGMTKEEVAGSANENGSFESTTTVEEQNLPVIVNEGGANPVSGAVELKDEMASSAGKDEESAVEQNHGDSEVAIPISAQEETQPRIPMPPIPDLNQAPAETELSFQPYHTVDYFASQGIKFVAEEKPVDRFGKQLKSFTEWLKTMKKLPQAEVLKTTDVVSEQKVEQMAEHSIDEGEVITETMAEVWIKQGNREKAIDTYNKLSLLNPDKSAYFASLAEQLKNS